MHLFQIAVSLFFVINSIGNIPLFIALLGRYEIKRQRRIIVRELLIALGILVVFNFFGDELLHLLGVTQPMIGIAGGILLFVISLGMIFPKKPTQKLPAQEPLIVPLAMPVVAGPGAIAAVMVYSEQTHNPYIMITAILLAWIPSALILFAASNIKKILGIKGLAACERLGGMLICLIAVKMFSCGTLKLIHTSFYECATAQNSKAESLDEQIIIAVSTPSVQIPTIRSPAI